MYTNYKRTVNKAVASPFLEFLKKYGIILLLIILFAPFIIKYIFDKITDAKIDIQDRENTIKWNENKDIIVQQSNADKITTRKDVQNSARDIAHHLGTRYMNDGWKSLFDPRMWTENDKEVEKLLKYQRQNIRLIERLYSQVYTKNRNLKDDINRLLDKENLQNVISYYQQKGTPWR